MQVIGTNKIRGLDGCRSMERLTKIFYCNFFYKLGNRTKNGSVARMFSLIYVHRKLTSEKENRFFDFIQKGRWAITKSVVG